MKKGIVGILSAVMGITAGAVGVSYFKNKKITEKSQKVDKFRGYYNLINQWLILKNEGKSLEKYFVDQGFKTIAIYGMGELGNRLYEELKNTGIEIKYAVDKNAQSTYSELNVVEPDDDMEEVDAVIVTATFAFDEVMEEIEIKFNCPIISLEDVVYEI